MSDDLPQPPTPTPGWYPDPSGQLRWWDGAQWTAQIASPPGGQSLRVSAPPTMTARTPVSGLAITALVIGLVSIGLILTGFGGTIAGLFGLLFGLVGISDTRGGKRVGWGFSITGVILGSLAIVISLLALAFRTIWA